jgi:para-nitrobenzyl esterase
MEMERSCMWLCMCLAVAWASTTYTIDTTHGPVTGQVQLLDDEHQVLVFYSIPFADPPVGDLRFKSPRPPSQNWTEPKDCTTASALRLCIQLSLSKQLVLGTEDCLYLDIYVPLQGISDRPLPVMFWIFGGGYTIGDGYEFGWYDGKRLAHEKQVIVVVPNYRVNVLGFLALNELKAEDPNHSTGNMALHDQRLALQWVQDNIAAFSGDPGRVTIFGESAGAFSVCWHLVSPASKGLFSAAIMESGTCSSWEFFQPLERAIAFGQEYALSIGCQDVDLSMSSIDVLACLRKLPSDDLIHSLFLLTDPDWPFVHQRPELLPPLSPLMPFGPAIDGVETGLLDFPQHLLDQGKFNRVPLILGTNKDEGSIFVLSVPSVARVSFPLDADSALTTVEHFFNESISPVILNLYMNQTDIYEFAISKLLNDYFFACPNRRIARAFNQAGVSAFLYQFVYELRFIEAALLGVYHTAEIDFVWNNQWPPLVRHSLYWF